MLIYGKTSYYGNSGSSERNAIAVTGTTSEGTIFKVYFSYETPIAVRIDGKLTISENNWGPTTGKHLNSICTDKSIRVANREVLAAIKTLTTTIMGNPSMTIDSYQGNSAGSQLNSIVVRVGSLRFYFSYETLVGVTVNGKTTVRENVWGPTTGKHLNAIASKEYRVSETKFKEYTESLYIPQAARDVFVF